MHPCRHRLAAPERNPANGLFETGAEFWKNKFPNKKIVASVDRLERLKGIPLKLTAIDMFLSRNPDWQGRIIFALMGISAIERGDDYRITQLEVASMVRDLNAKYGQSPGDIVVWYEERSEETSVCPKAGLFRCCRYFDGHCHA